MQIKGGKLIMQPESDIVNYHSGALTSFIVTHPGLAAVKVDMF